MKIFLTGATGFIGSHLLERLLSENHQVTILKRDSSDTWRIQSHLSKIKTISENQFEQYFFKNPPELIFHLATHYVKNHQPDDIAKMIDGNIKMPSLLAEYAKKFGTKYFINIGTCFEYATSDKKITEKEIPSPFNFYAATKIAFENILEFYSRDKKFRTLTLRLFYPYGEKDNQKVIPLMIKSLLHNEQLVISKGEQNLDYIYVNDIVDACLKSLEFISSNQYTQYEIFNIGEGKGKQLKQIVEILNRLHGDQLLFCEKEYPENEIMHMVANISKAKKLLHWQPKTDIKTGLQNVYSYYKTIKR